MYTLKMVIRLGEVSLLMDPQQEIHLLTIKILIAYGERTGGTFHGTGL